MKSSRITPGDQLLALIKLTEATVSYIESTVPYSIWKYDLERELKYPTQPLL